MKNNHYAALVGLVLLLGLLLRICQFPHLPPGFNQDEAASAYEAFSLAETGLDRWGNAWPPYFPGWGSGQNVLLAYLTIPAVQLLGLNVISARLVLLLTGLLTLPLLWGCLRPLGRRAALLATGLLAVVPWHFMLSRWGLESNLVPFFMLLGCFTLSRALITRRRRWVVPALLPFALSLYAYGTTVVLLPGLLFIVGAFFRRQLWAQRGQWGLAAILFGLVAAPFGLFFLENYLLHHNLVWTDRLPFATPLLPSSRLSQNSAGSWGSLVLGNLRFVLGQFNDHTPYNVLSGIKPLLLPTLALAVAGLVLGGRQLRQLQRSEALPFTPRRTVLLVFGAWAVASLPLLLAFDLNVNRFNHFYLPAIVLAVWVVTTRGAAHWHRLPALTLRRVVLGAWALESSLAVFTYFTRYPAGRIQRDFNAGLGEAFAVLPRLPANVQQVRISQQMALPYVYTLFFLRYPPARFQREARYRVEDGEYKVQEFGRYVFEENALRLGHAYGYLSRRDEYPDNATRHREVHFRNGLWEVGVMRPGPRQQSASCRQLAALR